MSRTSASTTGATSRVDEFVDYDDAEDEFSSDNNLEHFRHQYREFERLDFVLERDGGHGLPPSRKCIIITCIDARIFPEAIFHLQFGEAHVIRNAGGSAPAALRDIVISQQFLGTEEIFLVKHDDCGMLTATDQDMASAFTANLTPEGAASVQGLSTYAIKDIGLEEALQRDLGYLRSHPAIKRGIKVHGWLYSPKTGKIREVATDPRGEPDHGEERIDHGNDHHRDTESGSGTGSEHDLFDDDDDYDDYKAPPPKPAPEPTTMKPARDPPQRSATGIRTPADHSRAKISTRRHWDGGKEPVAELTAQGPLQGEPTHVSTRPDGTSWAIKLNPEEDSTVAQGSSSSGSAAAAAAALATLVPQILVDSPSLNPLPPSFNPAIIPFNNTVTPSTSPAGPPSTPAAAAAAAAAAEDTAISPVALLYVPQSPPQQPSPTTPLSPVAAAPATEGPALPRAAGHLAAAAAAAAAAAPRQMRTRTTPEPPEDREGERDPASPRPSTSRLTPPITPAASSSSPSSSKKAAETDSDGAAAAYGRTRVSASPSPAPGPGPTTRRATGAKTPGKHERPSRAAASKAPASRSVVTTRGTGAVSKPAATSTRRKKQTG